MAIFLSHYACGRAMRCAAEHIEEIAAWIKTDSGSAVYVAVYFVASLLLGLACVLITDPIHAKIKKALDGRKQKKQELSL